MTLRVTAIMLLGANSEPSQTSKKERFGKIVIGFHPITIFAKRSIVDVGQLSEYVPAYLVDES